MSIAITINDIPVQAQAGETILEAARAAGVIIPTLCYHKALSPAGSCRLCVVEVDKWRGQVAACTTQVAEGMVIRTETPSIVQSRRTILELLLCNYVDSGFAAHDQRPNEFMHWVEYYQAQPPVGAAALLRYPVNSDPNPFLWLDFNKCILCTRCVRACAEIQGRFVWGVGQRGHETRIIAGADTPLLEARCESCGACVAVCPTGALDHKMSIGLGSPDRVVTTTCAYCGVGCQFDLNVKDDRIIRVTSNPESPVNGLHLCVKGRFGYDFVHHSDRLARPRVRRYLLEGAPRPKESRGEWVEVDWEVALEIAARKLAQARNEHGGDSVGVLTSAKCLNEENYLMNKLARQVIGTHNIDHCARL
ncbi:MAG: 2Fe-2S iron-sulfur cluster-binding protein [Chloroflexi bacterium]|nr:2Fe-2S iron-sulfur cluster-binding protein [Chloroflexota bacterium]